VGLVGDRLQDYWWVFSGQGESRKLFRILMGFALARIGYLGLGCGVRCVGCQQDLAIVVWVYRYRIIGYRQLGSMGKFQQISRVGRLDIL